MKKIFIITILLISTIITFGQTTVSKSCGKCLKSVSITSTTGDYCPHCGVRWGYENSTTTTSTSNSNYNYLNTAPKPSKKSAKTSTGSVKSKNNTTNNEQPFVHFFDSYTKPNLENWLVDKLSKYSKEKIYCPDNTTFSFTSKCWSDKDFEFKFKDGYFIVKYNHNDEYNKIDYLPISYFSYTYGESYSRELSFSSTQTTKTEIDNQTVKKTLISYIHIGFKGDAEENLIEKIKSAFLRLKKISIQTDLTTLPDVLFPSDLNKPSIPDTKQWILNKLNKYTENQIFQNINGGYSGMKNPVFSFSAMNLIIDYYNAYNDLIQVVIPICECNTSNNIYNDYFNSTTYENYSFFSKEELITIRGNQTKKFYIKLNFDKEDNLYSRLQKAFNSLKEDCPKKTKEKEVF